MLMIYLYLNFLLQISFFTFSLLNIIFVSQAFAESTGDQISSLSDAYKSLGVALAAGIAIGLAAFGGALGQGKAVQAAMEGIGRNPGAKDKLFVPMIVGLALIESLVIYALLISFLLIQKI